jgi:hypothetical protein
VQQTIIAMRLNASGVRDPARSLHICPYTVLRELQKQAVALEAVNITVLRPLHPLKGAWDVERAGAAAAEMEERWSFVGNKNHPRWRWHALEHHTGKGLGLRLWAPQRQRLFAAQSAIGALRAHPLLHLDGQWKHGHLHF